MNQNTSSANPLRKIYNWTLSLAEKKLAGLWLGLLSFAEASFFPIPPDVLLIPLCLGKMKKAFKFAFICSLASVLGGLAGYALGAFAWDELSGAFFQYIPGFTEEKFEKTERLV
jgi:membrane protein YqaA with SNARE-associated domain